MLVEVVVVVLEVELVVQVAVVKVVVVEEVRLVEELVEDEDEVALELVVDELEALEVVVLEGLVVADEADVLVGVLDLLDELVEVTKGVEVVDEVERAAVDEEEGDDAEEVDVELDLEAPGVRAK